MKAQKHKTVAEENPQPPLGYVVLNLHTAVDVFSSTSSLVGTIAFDNNPDVVGVLLVYRTRRAAEKTGHAVVPIQRGKT